MITEAQLTEMLENTMSEKRRFSYHDVESLIGEVRRLNAVLAEKEEIIHRLNDKLDAARGGEEANEGESNCKLCGAELCPDSERD